MSFVNGSLNKIIESEKFEKLSYSATKTTLKLETLIGNVFTVHDSNYIECKNVSTPPPSLVIGFGRQ